MFRCKRCGSSFSPIRAAVLEYCPRCRARHGTLVPLITKRVDDPPKREGGKQHGHAARPPRDGAAEFRFEAAVRGTQATLCTPRRGG